MDNKKNVRFSGMGIYMVIVIIAAMFIMYVARMNTGTSNYTYNELVNDISKGKIESVSIRQNAEVPTGVVTVKVSGEQSVKSVYVSDVKDVEELLLDKNIEYTLKDVARQSVMLTTILPFGLSILVIVFIMMMFTRQAGGGGNAKMMNFGKSRARMISSADNKVTFKDVAGLQEEKEELEEIVDFLKDPVRYTSLGARIPKGVILTGAPGTGKTLLAKAVAGEASVPFFSISGSDFVEMFVGVGASRVRDMFEEAKKNAPCIIFIDEIDAIGKSRDNQYSTNDEREQTLNQLLSEMDGFDATKGIVILAATNRPEVLDKALLRPGRFDRRIIVEKPDLKGREDILKVHIKHVKTDSNIDLHAMALATSGAVGADLANMVNEAALSAVRHGRQRVLQSDLMEAVEVIIAGKEKKDRILSEKEKRIVAYHEVGHALAAALQKNTQPVQKITIVPRTMGALGYTLQMPEEEEHYLMTKDEILDQIVVFLAGRCAEEVVFNTCTTGASNDIERATALARNMITQYGMSERFGMAGLESIQNKYLDGRSVSNCSEETKTEIDHEVISLLKQSHTKATQLLEANRQALDKISEFLIEKETITGTEFMDILNQVNSPEESENSDATPDTPDENNTVTEIKAAPKTDAATNNNADTAEGAEN